MYPYELDLRKEIFGYVAEPFLQLMITIKDKKIVYKTIWKKGYFSIFKGTHTLPRYCCSIENFCSLIEAEILISVRKTYNPTTFERNSEILINQKMKQGGKIKSLSTPLNKLLGRDLDVILHNLIIMTRLFFLSLLGYESVGTTKNNLVLQSDESFWMSWF